MACLSEILIPELGTGHIPYTHLSQILGQQAVSYKDVAVMYL